MFSRGNELHHSNQKEQMLKDVWTRLTGETKKNLYTIRVPSVIVKILKNATMLYYSTVIVVVLLSSEYFKKSQIAFLHYRTLHTHSLHLHSLLAVNKHKKHAILHSRALKYYAHMRENVLENSLSTWY